MTKKLILSSVAVATLATAAFAGTSSVTSQSVGAESVASARYFNNIDMNVSYSAVINGTLNQGSVIYTFTNVELNSSLISTLNVYNHTTNSNPAITSSCSAGSSGRIICDINDTITDGDTLVLADDNTSLGNELFDINTSAGFTGSTISVALTNSATTTIDSASAANWLTTATEWTATSSGFSNQIDASNSFLSFTSSSDSNASVTISQTSPDIASPAGTIAWSVLPDQNTSAFGTMNQTGGSTQGRDNNYTSGTTTLAAGTLYADFTPDNSNAISETTFTTGLTMTLNGSTSNLIAAGTSFGSFTTYGYTAQIPGASYSTAAQTDTIISLVNTGSSDTTDVVVTLQDADGNSCQLTSASDSELTRPTSGTTTKIRLSTLLGNSACSSLTGTGYSIELSVPTTPTNIYANAFVRNAAINQFKVLPVYNNGNSY